MDAYVSRICPVSHVERTESVDGNAAERGRYPVTERSEGTGRYSTLVAAPTKEVS
jgi:hypothetical protein